MLSDEELLAIRDAADHLENLAREHRCDNPGCCEKNPICDQMLAVIKVRKLQSMSKDIKSSKDRLVSQRRLKPIPRTAQPTQQTQVETVRIIDMDSIE